MEKDVKKQYFKFGQDQRRKEPRVNVIIEWLNSLGFYGLLTFFLSVRL